MICKMGVESWKLKFMLLGLLTVLISMLLLVFVPRPYDGYAVSAIACLALGIYLFDKRNFG